ncbi:glycosyltransferase family 4 protein [Uliginosibacterium flavum]|uniref:Glycosyltransferase family 4 protein n=1 Tax=Uliginosibacterium flavum TaxID=1396831 RepID=A0ABV2TRX8_9RHOO
MALSDSVARPWLAVFDLNVTRNSPAGSCVHAEVMGLADSYDITVFSGAFDNERPDRVRWVHIPLPKKPGFLKYIVFQVLGPWALRRHIRDRGCPPMAIQATQGQFIGADVCYPHFCHRAYLAGQWKLQKTTGLHRLMRWCSYRYNAWAERRAFLKARKIITPSRGLARELEATYPFVAGKVEQIANPVDLERFARPADFDAAAFRASQGLPAGATVLSFAALGDFERKGLGLIIDALALLANPSVHVLVVGGTKPEIAGFAARAEAAGVAAQCHFVGFQKDVCPYMWASDAFVFPSTYEIFSLVLLQALAAGVPTVATPLYGFEEYARHGENAWVIERTPVSVAAAIAEIVAQPQLREAIGRAAASTAQNYGRNAFVQAWHQQYLHLAGH